MRHACRRGSPHPWQPARAGSMPGHPAPPHRDRASAPFRGCRISQEDAVTMTDHTATDQQMTPSNAPVTDDEIFAAHEGGKLAVSVTAPIADPRSLAIAYTPGVAKVCRAIAEDASKAARYTWAHRVVAVGSDGT